MITIITCSINPDLYNTFKKNVQETAGIPIEFIYHDNRIVNWNLCKVYNHYSALASYNIICYIHEDILFTTDGWGKIIVDFYNKNNNAGVIGFAGSIIKTKALSGWSCHKDADRYNFTQGYPNKPDKLYYKNPHNEDFSEVICLDGFCMFATKKTWEQHKFNEKLYDHFHLYDISFSTAIALTHKNYICNIIKIKHLSPGSFSTTWYKYSRIFHKEMSDILPLAIHGTPKKYIRLCEKRAAYNFAKEDYKNKWSNRNKTQIIRDLYKETDSKIYTLKYISFLFRRLRKKYLFS
ncbi:MAG: glycosyltransferase [Tannerellaceae bacterium]